MEKLHLKNKRTKIWLISFATALAVMLIAVIIILAFSGREEAETESRQVCYTDPQAVGLSSYGTYEYLSDGDEDHDGLTNEEEEKLGTDLYLADTDEDGLSDYTEVNVTKTNPLKADTDVDGLMDGDETWAGLNPNEKSTDGETPDSTIIFEETIGEGECTVDIKGNAGIYSIYIEKSDIIGLSKTPGVLSNVYDYKEGNTPESAEIVFKYNKSTIKSLGIDLEELSVCEYNNGVFKPVDSEVDQKEYTVKASLKNSSKYALCNMEAINTDAAPQVLLLIDNSGSMYPKEVLAESDENDVEFKRIDMASQLIKMAEGKIEFGLAKFTGSYTLMAELGSDEEVLDEKLESIRTDEEKFNGTYIETSLMKSINLFDKNDNEHRNFVVMLTDGYSTEGQGLFSIKLYDEEDIIEKANENNVTLIIIGLGTNVDIGSLVKMTGGTDGMYIGAYNAGALEQIYEKIMSAINYNLEDIDGDGENDRVLIADSGFTVSDNGFPYENYKVIDPDGKKRSGQCFGIANLCQLYYTGKLPLTMNSVEGLGTGFLGLSGKLNSEGYDAGGSFFAKQNGDDLVLNNVEMSKYRNETLEVYKKIRKIPVKERYTNQDGYLKFSDEVMELIDAEPLLVCEQEKTSKKKYEEWEYTSYDDLYINLYNVDEGALSSEQLKAYKDFKMIFRLYVVQLEEKTKGFSINNADLEGNAQLKAMDRLIEMVKSGVPPIISSCEHSINITRIYRDLENPDLYTLVVYNNNETGEEYELTVERRENKVALNVTEWINDYIYTVYDADGTFTGEKGKKIDMTIEDVSWLWD